MTICLKKQHQTSLATVLQRRPTPLYCMFIQTYPFSCQSYSKRNIYKPLPFTNNQTTHRVGHVFSSSNSCMSESPPGQMGFPLNQELGNNYTGHLGPQLCKRIHNKPTEQASPTCPSQGTKLLERGNSESFR